MNTYKNSNVSLSDLRRFLFLKGANPIRTTGGHEIWSHRSLNRPIVLQTHIDPVPRFIVNQILNHMDTSKKELWELINKDKGSATRKSKVAKKGKRSNKGRRKI